MNLKRMLELTQELVNARGPCGQEEEVRTIVLREMEGLCDRTWIDEAGNAVGFIAGRARKPAREKRSAPSAINVMAHMDELSLLVKRVEADGTLRVRPLGGIFPWSFGLGPVEIMGDAKVLPGVLSVGPMHTTAESSASWKAKASGENKSLDWPQVYVFTRMSCAELERAGVHAGTRVVVACSRRGLLTIGDCVGGYFLDDRVCLAILLAAASLLKAQGRRPAGDVYLVATCLEEIGGGAAAFAAGRLPGTITLAIDVGPVAREYSTTLSKEPIVVYGDKRGVYSRAVCEGLVRAGRSIGLRPQTAYWESYGSDASISKSVGNTPQSGLLCIPTENTHGYEIVPREAIETCARLLAAYLQAPQ